MAGDYEFKDRPDLPPAQQKISAEVKSTVVHNYDCASVLLALFHAIPNTTVVYCCTGRVETHEVMRSGPLSGFPRLCLIFVVGRKADITILERLENDE